MAITNYKQLDVWARAMDVAEAVYEAVKQMPKQEEYRLTAQMIRAAISVPANIAEGNLRATRKDYAHFISIAQGSAAELETLLLLAQRTRLLSENAVAPLLDMIEQVGRMLNRLHARLTESSP
jgi:four helix bundle protein